MSYNYLVTAHKGTVVTSAITGSFTGPNDLNLIQARGKGLVINLVTAEGLQTVLDVDIFGRIVSIQLFRPENELQDLLFLVTARYHIAILSFDANTRDIITRGYGDIKDRVGKPTQGKQVALIDPKCRVAALHLYTGLLKIVPLEFDSGRPLKAFNVRLDDLYVIDMQFISGYDKPTIVYIAEEESGRVLKSYVISTLDQELLPGPWKLIKIEEQANLLWPVPTPYNGVLVIGLETISYYNDVNQHCIDSPMISKSVLSCITTIDYSRYLVGDANGRILMLFLEFQESMDEGLTSLTGMKLEDLGETSIPYCLSYLDNGVVFVGSTMGDSQLIKLSSTASVDGGFIEVLDSLTNIGPILDMSIVDLDKQGRDILVCCSGTGKNGSLRIVKSGIGINEHASIDLQGIRGVWSLCCGNSQMDNTLVLSFVEQTTALSLSGEEVEETELPGLAVDYQTFFCANVIENCIIQITSRSVRLINQLSLSLIVEWTPPDGRNISTAACNKSQVVVAVGSNLYLLEIKPGLPSDLVQMSTATMDHEIACVDINPIASEDKSKSSICAVGLWTEISVRLLALPNFENIYTQPLGGDIIPRSILMVEMGDIYYLLCALGDGCLIYYILNLSNGCLDNPKRVILGTKPIILRLFESGGITNVFACSDHPTIIHSTHQKLLFSNVNIKEVTYMCTLNSESFQDSLALVDNETLIIGSVDQIQMLHIDMIPLGESPRCISYDETCQSFLVGSYRIDTVSEAGSIPIRQSISVTSSNITKSDIHEEMKFEWSNFSKGEEIEMHSLLLMDQLSFEVQHVYQLCPQEHVLSICTCNLLSDDSDEANAANDGRQVFVVGTALVRPEDKEPSFGRILVFQVIGGKIELVHEKIEQGAVYQVKPFNRKLVTSVNSYVHIMKWVKDSSFELECSFTNNILALYLKTKGDFILIGDILRSLKLLVYKNEQGLEEIGTDIKVCPSFCTAIEMIDDENYVAADGRHIYICQKNTEATIESEMLYMLQPSRIYIGDNINVFQKGSLVMDHPGSSSSRLQGKPLLFGTVHGALGLVGQLKQDTFNILDKVQQRMANCIKSVGNIEHEVYRAFFQEHRTKPMAGFVDGDLIEKFIDLPRTQMDDIMKDIKITDSNGVEIEVSVDGVVKIIEDLSRLH